ncbi:hypothetical protein CLAIMM_05295 isoform 3 [Cladophialophora immunda]|nr:hypothetical protein CLAIMM_05295 isoform 2 [Cladophialophora immunda]OQU99700.1 hypothetical protein CLAIMM_05295 isoform 3 [Cladophialophora immunda]
MSRGPVKGYIDVLEGRLYELESALLQVLPLVSNEQLDEITASIPPIPSRPHFRARFSQANGTAATPPPSEIVFHGAQPQQHHQQETEEKGNPRQRHHHQRHQQQSPQLIPPMGIGPHTCPLQRNQEYLKQMMSGSWHQQQHLPPLELGPFTNSEGPWPPPSPLLLAGDPLARQGQSPFSPARHSFDGGGGGGGGISEFDLTPEIFTRGSGARETTATTTNTPIMVSARGF